MRLDKVIIRAALSTLAAIAIMLSVMTLALCFLYPSTMMKITYDLGMDGSSIRNAKRAYVMSGKDVYFIAYATEVAIGLDEYEKIEECGETFIADDEFDKYCAERDKEIASEGGYRQYICSQVCLSKYALGKKVEAVTKASELLGKTFPKNNALAAVGIRALTAGDKTTAKAVQEKMIDMSTTEFSNAEMEYYGKILSALEKGLNG